MHRSLHARTDVLVPSGRNAITKEPYELIYIYIYTYAQPPKTYLFSIHSFPESSPAIHS